MKLLAPFVLFAFIPVFPAFSDDSGISMRRLTGPLYLVEDNHYVRTNSLLYIRTGSVTVIGATWTPETARLLAGQIDHLTNLPIGDVIDTSPDPEWSGGNGFWRSIGASILAFRETSDMLKSHWTVTVEAFRVSFPTYPSVPLVSPAYEDLCREIRHPKREHPGAIPWPSHTAADVFVYFPKEKVLDAGSILKQELGNVANADIRGYPKTLHKLQNLHLDIDTIISGHWSAVHGPDLIDHYLELLKRFEEKGNDQQ
jgi:metallo-beta-lactamase class B